MITHKDQTFCSSAGHCANRECYRWIDFGAVYDLPVSVAELKDTDICEGYVEHPALKTIKAIFG